MKKKRKSGEDSGLEWPLDQWYIERMLFVIYGGATTFLIFLSVLFGSLFLLILAMFMGMAQLLFALKGIDIFVKILSSMGMKEKQNM